jgi:hypothetical protein
MPFPLRDLPNAALLFARLYELPLFSDEELAVLLVKRLAAHGQRKTASLLRAWLDYSSARSRLPEHRIRRIPLIAQQLLRGGYHRFAHGFGSVLRDLRKPAAIAHGLQPYVDNEDTGTESCSLPAYPSARPDCLSEIPSKSQFQQLRKLLSNWRTEVSGPPSELKNGRR